MVSAGCYFNYSDIFEDCFPEYSHKHHLETQKSHSDQCD